MLKVLILVTVSFVCPRFIHCQHKDSQQAWLATQNILTGGLISGIGGGINRAEGESFWKGFGNGFKYGCLGGFGLYLGKKLIYPVNSKESLAHAKEAKNEYGEDNKHMDQAIKSLEEVIKQASLNYPKITAKHAEDALSHMRDSCR